MPHYSASSPHSRPRQPYRPHIWLQQHVVNPAPLNGPSRVVQKCIWNTDLNPPASFVLLLPVDPASLGISVAESATGVCASCADSDADIQGLPSAGNLNSTCNSSANASLQLPAMQILNSHASIMQITQNRTATVAFPRANRSNAGFHHQNSSRLPTRHHLDIPALRMRRATSHAARPLPSY